MTERVLLRDVTEGDLPTFFDQQMDSDANHMAAFTAEDPTNWDLFSAHWSKILSDDTVIIKTILLEEHVAGHVAKFERFGKAEVTYWIGKPFWGKGLATKALSDFLGIVDERPLHARAAADNVASIRVLEKCGFAVAGHEKAFANARGKEIEEVIMKLG